MGERKEISPEWVSSISEGISAAIENYELFDSRINFEPDSISDELDARTW